MDIRDIHYDYKQKLNKIDSQQYRNLRVPEIDWKINEATNIFIKLVAQPRIYNHLGFETSQRTIDDIRTIVISDTPLIPINNNDNSYYVELPDDYMFYLSSKALITKDNCGTVYATCIVRQHDDRHEESPFDSSSFEWREVNIRFYDKGIKIFTDGTFIIDTFYLNYIRKHPYIHNAQDYLPSGTYKLPNGQLLTGSQNIELPEHVHSEIVDIAVLITSGDLSMADYQLKQAKINLNQIN